MARSIMAWTGNIAAYTVQGPTGLRFGTFAHWEDAQVYAKTHVNESTTGELFIMRGTDTLEIVQEGREVLPLKIAGGVCCWCETDARTEVVCMPDGAVCQGCSGEVGYGEEAWNYLRG